MLFRAGVVAGAIMNIAFLLLPLALYQLLHTVNKTHAIIMVALAVVSLPFSFSNLVHNLHALTLLRAGSTLEFDAATTITQVMLQLTHYNNGTSLVSTFWGLWLLPFGSLVFRSGFLPKVLGFLLMLGGADYLINFTGRFLSKQYASSGISAFVSLPASLGEIKIDNLKKLRP